jgi:mandelate racemase
MTLPLQTSSGTISIAPLALIDLHTEEGVTGSAYLFCYTPLVLKPVVQLIANLAPVIKGDLVAPLDIERKLQSRFRLLGAKGVAGMALAGIDMAAWDALAKAQGMPLVRALGGEARRIPAYNSCGLGMIGAERAAEEVKRAIGDDILLMADYNQALSVAEAARRIQALDGEGLYWIEEPILADDYAGYAHLRSKAGTPIQMGENWWGPHEMAKCLATGATDYGMPDAMKIGGVTGWQQAAAIAEVAGLPVSSHLFPEVSAHLLAASPTCHWLEYVDWAAPILQQPLKLEGGYAIAPDVAGSGIAWDEAGVERCLVP